MQDAVAHSSTAHGLTRGKIHLAARREKLKASFAALDADKDGVLSEAELVQVSRPLCPYAPPILLLNPPKPPPPSPLFSLPCTLL